MAPLVLSSEISVPGRRSYVFSNGCSRGPAWPTPAARKSEVRASVLRSRMGPSVDTGSLRTAGAEGYNRGVGRPNRGVFGVLAVFLAVIAAVVLRSGGPPPRPATAPSNEFSAARAAAALRDVLGGNVPHPVGS